MSFKLYPLPHSKLANIRGIFTMAKEELRNDRADIDEVLAAIDCGYDSRRMAVYVDDINSPNHCLVLALMPGIATKGMLVTVLLIYSKPEGRTNPDIVPAMMNTINNYATFNGAKAILGSAWKYKGARGIDSLWLANGYEIQETVYVKTL